MSTNTWSTALSWSETVKLCVAAEFAESAPHPPEAALEKIQADPSRAVEMMEENRTWITQLLDAREACKAPIQDIALFASNDERVLLIAAKIAKGTAEGNQALAHEIRRSISRLVADESTDPEFIEDDGILTWDERLASFLEQNGRQDMAKAVRASASKRRKQWDQDHKASSLWFIWQDPTRYATAIGTAVWPSVKAKLTKHVALVRPVFAELTCTMSSPYKTEEANGQRVLCYKNKTIEIAQVDQGILELVDKGFEKLGTIVSHRVIREIVFSGYGKQMMGQTEVTLAYPGGMQTFCSAAGCTSNADPVVARQILHALAYLPFKLPNGFRGNLITLQEQRAGNGRQGMIVITPGPPLLANYVFGQTGEDKLIGKDRFLVPLLPIPPLVGRPNNHAQQVVLSQYVVLEMRDRAREMAKDGAIKIPQDRWVELAIKARMPRDASLLAQVIDRWAHDGDDGPALLSRANDMFTLADTHEAAKEYIIKGGRISERASERSKKRKSKRDAAIEEKTPRKRVQKVGS